MPISTRVNSKDRNFTVLLNNLLSPKAQSKAFANFAREKLEEGQEQNRKAIGSVPDHETFVDGKRDAPLDSVKPDGVIVFEFDLIRDLFIWIDGQLRLHSPVLTGRYRDSNKFFADGVEADPANPPAASDEWVFLSTVPYARKIERGQSKKAPDGVYEVVATLAKRRFGNQARIDFSYRTIGKERQPAIVISHR